MTADKCRMAKVAGAAPAKEKRPSQRSYLEERLALFIAKEQLPEPRREYRFAPPRLWRFDFAYPDRLLAIEIEGGIFIRGGHSRGVDFTDDCEKYSMAALLGWRVLRFTVKQFESGWVFQVVQAVLSGSDAAFRALLNDTIGADAIQAPLALPLGRQEKTV